MAELPDIDTTQVGMFAYWNAKNHGAASIDPGDCLSYGPLASYTTYENGFDGEVASNHIAQNPKIRVKSDGWIACWLSQEDSYGENGFTKSGQYCFQEGNLWDRYRSSYSLVPNRLSKIINGLQNQLSNSGSITFNHGDVGVYCYKYPQATTLTQMYLYKKYGGKSATFSIPGGTTLHYFAMTGECDNHGPLQNDLYDQVTGTRLFSKGRDIAIDCTQYVTKNDNTYKHQHNYDEYYYCTGCNFLLTS